MIAAALFIFALILGIIAAFHLLAVPHALAFVTILVFAGLVAMGSRLP